MKQKLPRILRASACVATLALGVSSAVADYSSTLTSLNPLAYWKLNEPAQPAVPTYTMVNSSAAGAALDGLYYGVPTLQAAGAVAGNAAANFDLARLQYAEVPYSAALNPVGAFTVEFWAYPTNVSAGAKSGVVSRYIPVTGGPAGQRGYLFFANNGNTKWQFRVYDGAAGRTITAFDAPDVALDTWQHVVGVYDGTAISIYINGALGNLTNLVCGYVANTNTPLRIGAGTSETAPSLYFPGILDEVAVYPTALTPSEIAAHYAGATADPAGYAALIAAKNPAGYWRMNEAVLPPYAGYAATNSSSLGSALDGEYARQGAVSGVAGPVRGQFAGFAADNGSVRLNATGTSGRVTTPPVTGMTTDHVTLTCWVKRAGSQSPQVDTAPLFFNEATSGAAGLNFQYQTRNLAYHWESGSKWAWTSGLLVPDDVWTFVALVITPTNGVMYMGTTNGLTSKTNTAAHDPHDFSSTQCILGGQLSAAGRYLKGWLDEFAIFDQALDATSISNLFYSATPAIPLVTRTADPLYEGMNVTFTAFGVGSVPVTYQWRKGGGILSGKTASTLVLSNVTTAASGDYDVVVTGSSLSVTSAVTPTTVVAGPPIIVQQPVSATRYEGAAVTFAVSIQGSIPWSFQWKQGVSTITGATNSSYTIPTIKAADAGSYSVTISNPLGSTNSAAAILTVLPVDNYAAQVAYSGAGAYWQMNEKAGTTAVDYIGGNNCNIVGPLSNNVVSVRPPAQAGYSATNTCFVFSGNSADYLVTPAALPFTNTSITMAAWVMPYTGLLAVSSDVNFVNNVGGIGLNSAGVDGKVRAHPLWGSDTGLFFTFDTWNYIVVVWTPSGQTFYLDNGDGSGLQAKTVGGTVDPNTWKNVPFYIGRQGSRTDRGWPGQIDELALFDRALTPAEVTNLHLNAISGPTAPNIIAQPASQTVVAGMPVSFTVGVSGAAPMTYQWTHAGTNIPGATAKTLTIASTYYTDAGSYQVVAANGLGSPATSATATLTLQAPPSFANLTNGLVLHLRFDGTPLDSSGRTNDGAVVDKTPGVLYVPGKIGTSGVLVGTNGYVTIAASPDLTFGATDSFSVAFWVKCGPGNNDVPIFGNAVNSTYQDGWVFSEDGGKIEWTLAGVGDPSSVIADPVPGSPIITDGVWHSVVAAFDRVENVAYTYVDGVQVDTRSLAGLGSLDSAFNPTFGDDPGGAYTWDPVTYQVDDVGIWRRALAPGEAIGIYAAGQIGQSFDMNGPALLTVKQSGGKLELIWQQGTLQSLDSIGGTWTDVIGAVAPYHVVTPGGAKKFYRVKF